MPKKVKVGTVVSDKMDKTVVVSVAEHKAHKKYKKTMTFSKKYKVSDVNGTSKTGDTVSIVENRPISGSVRWVLDKVVEAAR